ncbi:MAG TPA: histidine kinase, partial [Chloroflexi bacterium]|nr:histidine kinase [Chloroflexota bacterium]
MGHGSILMATLGGQPQVVTFALDTLLEQGEDIREVYVIHLSPANPRIRRSLHKLSSEFSDDTYRGRKMRFRPIPVRLGAEVVPDIRSEVGANAAWQTVYNLLTELKKQRRT